MNPEWRQSSYDLVVIAIPLDVFRNRRQSLLNDLDMYIPANKSTPMCAAIEGSKLPLKILDKEKIMPTTNVVIMPRRP